MDRMTCVFHDLHIILYSGVGVSFCFDKMHKSISIHLVFQWLSNYFDDDQ